MSIPKFQNKYRIQSTRLPGWDYGSNGCYFVTICTDDREKHFGEIVETKNYVETHHFASNENIILPQNILNKLHFASGENAHVTLQPTTIGQNAIDNWKQIPKHFPFVELDEFVIMTNHVHGLLYFNVPYKQVLESNRFGPQSMNLASVIRGYKASVKSFATINKIKFSWQSSYHDRIVRNDDEFIRIREYIYNNPIKYLNKIKDTSGFYL